jgi:chromosome segregation ATPase
MGRWNGEERRRDPEPIDRLILEVPLKSNLDVVLRDLVKALSTRSSSNNSEVLNAINNLDRKVTIMSSNIDRIEKEAADAAENVGLVRTAIEELKTASDAMKAEIASLKEEVAKGQVDQARLDAAAAAFEKADDDIDAIVLPPAPDTSGGTTGGGTTPA